MAVARVHVRSWQAAYRNLLPNDYLEQLRPEDRAPRYDFVNVDPQKPQTIVAVEAGLVQGFATTAPSQDPDLRDDGELCELYVNPERWGRRIGVALVSAARKRLVGLGFKEAHLWALVGNVRADRFYRNDQWVPDGVQRTDSVWRLTVDEIRYRRRL
jgi:GNAT superfamily N-acetyltransferase